jgi:tetratricopeptide (TPR) repeat protein
MGKINLNKQKRHIPFEIKRTLRQEAGFGCSRCGMPILEYHHIIKWSKIRKHDPQHMMALCPTCHYTIESYTLQQQYTFKNNPFNLKNEVNKKGSLVISQGICAINTGDMILIGDGPLIKANDISFLEVYVNESNMLEISLNLFNEKRESILTIVKSEWIKGEIDLWDIEFISASKVLIIKEKEGLTNLGIDARNFPVSLEGSLWINGNLIKFDKKGIHLGDFTFLKSEKSQTEKWGIWHLDKDSFKFCLKEDATLTGSNLLSGCIIDLSQFKEIYLTPKDTPYGVDFKKRNNFIKSERRLKQSIETIKYFATSITIHSDYSDFGPFSRGIEHIQKKLASLFLEKKLARLYVENGKIEKAWEKYQEIHKVYNEFYNQPNIEEGELLLEIAKFLKSIGNNDASKECFTESVICFTQTGNIPFRLFDFGNNLFKDDELCYCASGNLYKHCHKSMSILKKDSFPSERTIEVLNMPEDKEFKITIYFLKEHKIHWSINIDEYAKGFKQIYCGQHKNSFLLNISVDVDIPAIIRLDCYGLLPIIREFILSKDGFKLEFG